jgi:hypothetical protein
VADRSEAHPLRWSFRAAHWWGLAALAQFGLSLPMALVFHGWLNSAIGHRYEQGDLFANLTTAFRFDHRESWAQLASQNAAMGAVLALVSMLLGMFFAGGWVTMAYQRQHTMRAALQGGIRFFGRYLRVWLCTLVALALLSWIVYGAPWRLGILGVGAGLPESDWDRMESFRSEWSAVGLRLAQGGIYVLGIALVLTAVDYARLRIAWRDTGSVVREYLGAWWLILSRPWKTLAPVALVGGIEATLVVLAGFGVRRIEGAVGVQQAGLEGVLVLAAISIMLVALRSWCRGARYAWAARVVEREVEPLPKPFA